MRAAWLVGTGVALALAAFSTVAAPSPHKLPRIGYLALSPILDTPSAERAGFLQGLREHGYEDGKNIEIQYASAEGDPEMLEFQAEVLVESGVDMIIGAGLPVIRAARKATDRIPIVMMFAADPVPQGLAQSLARPGSNVTGMSMLNAQLGGKRLELLKQALPSIRRVAVLWDASNPALAPEWQSTESTARQLRIELISVDVSKDPDLVRAFAHIEQTRPDALVTFVDLRTASYRKIIPEFALKQRLPTMFGLTAFVELGGLLSYAPDFADLSRRSAAYVNKILNGANPAELPIQQPTQFSLAVNLRTAKALGLQIPEAILLRADEVLR
jgi:putative ABC transport system substrate-binding protein